MNKTDVERVVSDTIRVLKEQNSPCDFLNTIVEDISIENELAARAHLDNGEREINAIYLAADRQAEKINSEGFESQVRFILEAEGPSAGRMMLENLEGELTYLNRQNVLQL